MLFILLVSVKGSIDINFPFACSSSLCPTTDISENQCKTNCMSPPCNYDSLDSTSQSWVLRFQRSGCYNSCANTGCDINSLSNTVCDSSCDNVYCGFDLGDCGYCASGCTKEMLLNSVCDPACNVSQCMYDNNACG